MITTSAARERPILFSGPMVRVILEGRKTQTRRVFKGYFLTPDQPCWPDVGKGACPYGQPGDRLWVRESFAFDGPIVRYYATDHVHELRRKRPSIYMPRWASRITLEITEVRVARLQSISEADQLAEGATPEIPFGTVWRKINTKPGIRWEDNPWVWAITFKRLEEAKP